MRNVAWLMRLVAVAAALAAAAATAHEPQPTGRIIVKLRAASPGGAAVPGALRIARLLTRSRVAAGGRAITERLHVLQPVAGADAAQTVAHLAADPDVEYAEAEQWRHVAAVPDDPLYAPLQWYLLPPDSAATVAAIDAQAAWGTTTGSPALTIAVIDTGVRYDHPDLVDVAHGGRLLPGYCFISDPFVNNGGTCRGATVSEEEGADPGDWITQEDLGTPECSSASPAASTWHGTRTSSLIGALTNNALGMAGVTWQGLILPVRALGRCGGADADIASSMLWAAGLAVAGSPPNNHPAKVINMSLGGGGACPQVYRDVLGQLAAQGVLVVVSAGNGSSVVDAPANCPGVAAVAGLRADGSKVGYSNLGPEVAVGAPAGDCVNSVITVATPCLYPVSAATNPGTTTPLSSAGLPQSSLFTDQLGGSNLGTSFAAPLVTGIGALMAAVNPRLGSCQLIARLREGAAPFPSSAPGESPQPPACQVPGRADDPPVGECLCTPATCGAGMARAAGALRAALRPVAAITLPAGYAPGATVLLAGADSSAAQGRSITSYAWSQVSGVPVRIVAAGSPTASITAPSCGLATLRLTVTDSVGAADSADVVVTPQSAVQLPPASPATLGSCTAPVQIGICPAALSVPAGGGGAAFMAMLSGTADTGVRWEVEGVAGGNATVGTLSTTGVYTPPVRVPSPATVTITAVASADAGVRASARLTLTPPGGGGSLEPATLGALALLALRRAVRRRRR